jgi:hypothetical protein
VSGYHLLVDWEVIEAINRLPRRTREILRRALGQIAATPDRLSDYREPNSRGIPLDVHLCGGFAIKYWIDFADRHVKVLDLEPADRGV